MLFFLTGDIQVGKTRWLLSAVDGLERRGVEVCGVVAPGIWVPRDGGFEKLGIDNLLLPEHETVPFARRRDLAQAGGTYDEGSQSARADLMWAIGDDAIARVNAHFEQLGRLGGCGPRLLVIDELGRLELLRGEGLTHAVDLLDRGATEAFAHALVVVRSGLLEIAHGRFPANLWNGSRDIAPDGESARLLATCFE